MPARLLVRRQVAPLRGTVIVPGDKSISHRAVMLAALAEGTSTIRNWLPAGDTLATLEVVRALGVPVEIDMHSPTAWDLTIEGQGLRGLRRPADVLDLRNAGTGIRLLAGILVGQPFPSTLDGSEQLRRRPMKRITEPLASMGADITSDDGHAPLHIRPSQIHGITYELPVASAQVKSAILLAGLFSPDQTRVFEPAPARNHTERLLTAMGSVVTRHEGWITLSEAPPGGRRLLPLDMTIPGDLSSAAFLIVAASAIPHSEIAIRRVGVNTTRIGLVDILRAMGAEIEVSNEQVTGGEAIADLSVRFSELHPVEIGGATVVRAIDEIPVWAVAATVAAGASSVRDAAELRVKEVDRIALLAAELGRMEAEMVERPDGFTVNGPRQLRGALVDSHDDHRLGMALAVAGLLATNETIVDDAGCIADSFPGFVETMQALGASMVWLPDDEPVQPEP